MPLYVTGLMGMPRRLQHYDVLSWQPWLLVAEVGALVILTGIMNVLLRGLASGWALSRGFTAMLSIKLLLVAAMVGLQVWAGIAWKQEVAPVSAAVQKVRIALTLQLVLGAVAVLLGLGVRSA